MDLPDPVAYTDAPSFRCDQEIVLRIHSSKPVRARFRRCADTGLTTAYTVEAAASLQPRTMHRWRGFEWKASVVLPSNTLMPGYYQVDVEHQDDDSRKWCMCVLVRHVSTRAVVVVASTNTWNAYNDFGGLSNYLDRATPLPLKLVQRLMKNLNMRLRISSRHWIPAVPLPERRPNARIHRDLVEDPGAAIRSCRAEAVLIRLLEREAIPFTVVSDRDFAYEISISQTGLVIFTAHSEYWSEEMIGRLAESIDRGISVVFLSGNNMYQKVQFLDGGLSVIRTMIPQSEVVPLIGTYSDAYGFNTYDAYRVTDATHWCFDGLGVQEASEFGHGDRRGASGGETDKIRPGGEGFRVVAVGKNNEGPAFMVCRDLPGGGFVFNVSSVSFTQCLGEDGFIRRLVLNLLRRAVALAVCTEHQSE